MAKIKRYYCGNGEGMFEEKNGEWVEWSEYQKLNKELQRLLQQCNVKRRFVPPFRVGKAQKRAVLDSNGLEVVIFPKGLEGWALFYCTVMNEANGV